MQAGSRKKLVLFASGSGTNVEAIANYFQDHPDVSISAVLTNKRDAKVIDRCNRLNISALYFNKWAFYRSDTVLEILRKLKPDLIVLAGFLWKIPESIVREFEGRIINIHPALLPKYGGKGMYGMHVHKAVKTSGDEKTGVTIHYVNERYDEGAVIKQVQIPINSEDSAEDIAKKVHQLEYQHYPEVIQELLT